MGVAADDDYLRACFGVGKGQYDQSIGVGCSSRSSERAHVSPDQGTSQNDALH